MRYILSVFTMGTISVIMVIGLAILTGYTGLFSMGNVGFMMIGAYVSAISYLYFGFPYIPALICGGVVSTLAGLIIGFPTFRSKLKGDIFAIAMLGFASSVIVIISNSKNKQVNGALGIKNIPKLTNWWVVLIIACVIIYLLWNFVHSAYGRNCRAVREQEVAAETMGVNVARTKLTALLINAFCTGVGGGLFGFYTTIIAPTMFTQNQSSSQLIAVVFGGINSITGPVLSSFFLAIMPELLRWISTWRLVIYGILIVFVMLVKPEGLLGYKELNFRWIKPLCAKLSGRKKKRSEKNGKGFKGNE